METAALIKKTVVIFQKPCYTFYMQIWFIGRTLASQAGKAGSTPVICFFYFICEKRQRKGIYEEKI